MKALPTAASGAPQGGRPSAQPLCAAEPQHSTPVPAMAPVDSGAPQGAQPSSQPPCAALPQQPTLLPTSATLNNMDYGPDDNLVEGFTQRWLYRDNFVTKASECTPSMRLRPLRCGQTRTARTGSWPLSNGSPTMMVMGMGMLPHSHNGSPKWRSGATMSCLMVTWCMAGSLPTPTGMHRSRTSRRGCMEMASQDSVFGSAVLISQAPISLATIGVRLSPTQVPFARCVGRSSTEQHGPNCWQTRGPNQGTRLPCQTRTRTS